MKISVAIAVSAVALLLLADASSAEPGNGRTRGRDVGRGGRDVGRGGRDVGRGGRVSNNGRGRGRPQSAGAIKHEGLNFQPSGERIRSALEENNAAVVRAAVETILVNGGNDPEAATEALETYFAEDFIQHNPSAPSGREAVNLFIGDTRPDGLTYEIGTVFADGDYVAIHFITTSPFSDGPQVGVDVFRIRNDLIVEHWDVLWPFFEPADTVSGNSMFPIVDGPDGSGPNEEANRKLVTNAVNRVYTFADTSVINSSFAEDLQQHGPTASNGREALRTLVSSWVPGLLTYEIGFVIAYGDFVLVHSRTLVPQFDFIADQVAVEIFRVVDGLITDIWDIHQDEVAILETVSGNAVFPIY